MSGSGGGFKEVLTRFLIFQASAQPVSLCLGCSCIMLTKAAFFRQAARVASTRVPTCRFMSSDPKDASDNLAEGWAPPGRHAHVAGAFLIVSCDLLSV